MKYLFVSSFFGFMLLFLATSDFAKEFFTSDKEAFENPLDAILGEKKLDSGNLRRNNFDSILKLNASTLKDSSALYQIRKLRKNLFLLTRKKFFYNNKKYSLFVKTLGDQIVSYHAVNDFAIRGAVSLENRIYFMGDDFTGISNDWQSSYIVKITCLNLDFKEQWSTVSMLNKSYFFYGSGLKYKDNMLIAGIIIRNAGGSSMCVDYYDLFLSKKGEPIRSVFLGTDACTGKNVRELHDITALFE
ncbi:hypothetical protein [Fluviicola chungangensis]|uniref:Uncharacterized protein n=1 Tax=Fluviicola chungangensis TaxID=2597671 RepID=A0A556N3B0_9FLAO|nr:hypothetical protein [Fluviicola chungangensis]TSJ46696.1 hypothetical protein FO442_05925 [Fluviicola chungangensis]